MTRLERQEHATSQAMYYEKMQKPVELDTRIEKKLKHRNNLTPDSSALVLVMVGLPARGKSFIAHKLKAFLMWAGCATNVFNAGMRRRASDQDKPGAQSSADFFDPADTRAAQKRDDIAMETLDELLDWLVDAGEVGIFDATNSNCKRRKAVVDRIRACEHRFKKPAAIVFIESLCDDQEVIEANLLTKVRASPDFKNMNEDLALADLRRRVRLYEQNYETVNDSEGAYIKMHNISAKVTAHQIFGRMSQRILPFAMSLHVGVRSVYLVALMPGLDGAAATKGFSDKIAAWVVDQFGTRNRLRIISSTQPSAIVAADAATNALGDNAITSQHSGLNPLDRGSASPDAELSGMGFNQRYPGGESFSDLVRRLEPVLFDIEASVDPVLVLSHATPCRALRAYFVGCEVEKCMGAATSPSTRALANEAHSAVELLPKVGGGWLERIHDFEC